MRFISIGTSPLMRLGLLPGFAQAGCQTGHFPHHNWMALGEEEGTALLEKSLLETKPDYLIFGGYAPKYFSRLPQLCKKHGAGFIYWAIEDPVGFDNTLFLAKKADFVFTTTQECIAKYKQHGITADLLLFACNPAYHKAGTFNADYDVDLALAASCYQWETRRQGYRIILGAAKESKRSLMVWGAGWDRKHGQAILGDPSLYHGYFSNSALPDLCSSAKIILGVQCDGSSLTQTSMRPYEVLGCRGFHLTQWTKATAHLFKEGRHLVTARTPEEALKKIKFYLARPSARERIAKQGQRFVYKFHTYEQRVRDIILPRLGL